MYYIFTSNKVIDMNMFEGALNTIIEDEFDFVTWDSYSGYIETGFSVSTLFKHQLDLINVDLGLNISVLGTPQIDELSKHLMYEISKYGGSYHSLADAVTLSLFNQNKKTKELFLKYFDNVGKELMDTVLTFVEHGSNVLVVSKLLYIHRNTMNQRLTRFCDLTGLDIRDVEHNQLIYLYGLLRDNINSI